MFTVTLTVNSRISEHLSTFSLQKSHDLFEQVFPAPQTRVESVEIAGQRIPVYVGEFWTSKQRQSSSIHEVSYRACFKAQLPRFFIELLTKEQDIIYDPFSGRGTTVVEAGLLGRQVIANDISPLSRILTEARFNAPNIPALIQRLDEVPTQKKGKAAIDLSMFYHPRTESEIVSLRSYLHKKSKTGKEDALDKWIRMVATNRLTGHSRGFFSVYTLPPNQAVSAESQRAINKKLKQKPDYRNTREIIVKKSKDLLRTLSHAQSKNLAKAAITARFLTGDAGETKGIAENSVQLTVTSPPFLDIVDYHQDNWLRCWFNSINDKEVSKKITMAKTVEAWSSVMGKVFDELYRITKSGGWVAFEVGEVRNGKVKLEECVVPLGLEAGFNCEGIVINAQRFTKTSNIWGIKNNEHGTNTNRIVLFSKNR